MLIFSFSFAQFSFESSSTVCGLIWMMKVLIQAKNVKLAPMSEKPCNLSLFSLFQIRNDDIDAADLAFSINT
ncbi:unnamed protein product [Rotaria sp. Silwood1]|nr:unnamed protein product [Rotaria sp. Silwood1]